MKKRKTKPKGLDAITVFGMLFVFAVAAYLVLNQPATDEMTSKEYASTTVAQKKVVREPAVAGQFYPADEKTLASMVDGFLNKATDFGLYGVRGLVVPHAGYVYSGETAGAGFAQIRSSTTKTVIVLAPSHRIALAGASLPDATHFKTPLGEVPVSQKTEILRKNSLFSGAPKAHASEHAIEVELPFLQRALGDFEVVPIVVGGADPKALADALKPLLDDNTLVVASSDLSHYHPYAMAEGMDEKTVDAISSLDYGGVREDGACGRTPVLTLMHVAEDLGWRTRVLDYKNSGDTAGDKSSVVGYASIAFYTGLNESEQEYLTSLARKTLESVLSGGGTPEVDEKTLPPKLTETSGCFVTLNKNGMLRGCIGHILPQEPLYRCVIDNAVSAALYDRRFTPVAKEELASIEIEVSVLSKPKELAHEGGEDLIAKLVPNVDGVVLKQGMRQSTYLPQVWEQLPDPKEFLQSLCLKGGMSANCWQSEKTEVHTYRAQVFEEK